jgi:hypothetical protein
VDDIVDEHRVGTDVKMSAPQTTEEVIRRHFMLDAESELEGLLKSEVAQSFINCIETTASQLRRIVVLVAKQEADERGGKVEKRDVLDAWERVTGWGDLSLWKEELKQVLREI